MDKGGYDMAEVKFQIIDNLGVISEGNKGWQKEINIISWNGRKAKVDIRDWGPDHEKIGKGFTLNKEEFQKIKDLLQKINIEEFDIE